MRGHTSIALGISVLAALWFAGAARAASPQLQLLAPRGGQRGTEVQVTFHGQRLTDALGVLFYSPGITASHVIVQKHGEVSALFSIAKDARLGEYALRLRTSTGISDLATFWVGPYKIVEDTGRAGNRTPAHAMPIGMNVTVMGQVHDDATNYYRVHADKGQRLSVEVLGMRLATSLFDPYLQILGSDGKAVLLTCDDTVFALADPVVTMKAPYTGTYYLALRDSTYAAPRDSWFMMHVGSFPRPTVVFPLGGPAGKPLAVKFLDDCDGPIDETIQVPATQPGPPAPPAAAPDQARTMDLFPEQDGLIAPTPNAIRIDSCTNVFSTGANHTVATAMAVSDPLPVALNGILGQPGEEDFFRITAKARESIDIRVIARELRSPIDSVLTVYSDKGARLAFNDDQTDNPDSFIRFVPRVAGQYLIGIADQIHRGGPDYVYRIEVARSAPSISTSLSIPQLQKRANYLQSVSVPRGNRFASVIRIYREGYNGPVQLSALDLPAGVKMIADPVPAGENFAAVVFQADPNATLAGALCQLQADALDPKVHLSGGFHFSTGLMSTDNAPMHYVETDRLAVAVTDAAPVSIGVDEPRTPLLQDGTTNLHIHVIQPKNFAGRISLQMARTPPGLHPSRVSVGPNQSDAIMPIGAEPRARPGKVRLCLRAIVQDRNGEMMVASDFFTLEVRESPMQIAIPEMRVAAGGSTTVTCPIAQHNALTGPAKVELLGLPVGCATDPATITAADTQVKFTIHADASTRTGNYEGIFLRVSYTQAGEPIEMNLGRGASIRVMSPRSSPKAPLASAKGAR